MGSVGSEKLEHRRNMERVRAMLFGRSWVRTSLRGVCALWREHMSGNSFALDERYVDVVGRMVAMMDGGAGDGVCRHMVSCRVRWGAREGEGRPDIHEFDQLCRMVCIAHIGTLAAIAARR